MRRGSCREAQPGSLSQSVSQRRELRAGETRIISARGFNYVIRRRMEKQRNAAGSRRLNFHPSSYKPGAVWCSSRGWCLSPPASRNHSHLCCAESSGGPPQQCSTVTCLQFQFLPLLLFLSFPAVGLSVSLHPSKIFCCSSSNESRGLN